MKNTAQVLFTATVLASVTGALATETAIQPTYEEVAEIMGAFPDARDTHTHHANSNFRTLSSRTFLTL